MKVFIGWSRERSRQLGRHVETLLKDVLRCETFFSPGSIPKGSDWFDAVESGLQGSQAAVFCLTPENVDRAWVHFEAGALRSSGARLYPYMLGEDSTLVRDPLARFQVTVSSEEDTRTLVERIAADHGVALQGGFESAWKRLSRGLDELAPAPIDELIPAFAGLFVRKTFEEPLTECPDYSWVDRYVGARETERAMRGWLDDFARVLAPFQRWLLEQLISQLDGYAREMKRFLLGERIFAFDDAGRVDLARPVSCTCCGEIPGLPAEFAERRRKQIRRLQRQVRMGDAPVLAGSLSFAKLHLDESEEKKQLIHRLDSRRLTKQRIDRCRVSYWDLDRIAWCRHVDEQLRAGSHSPPAEDIGQQIVEYVERELEVMWLQRHPTSEMPLHYGVRALRVAVETDALKPGPESASLLANVEKWLNAHPREVESPIQGNLNATRQHSSDQEART